MRAQLDAVVADLDAAERRLRALRDRLPAELWGERPAAEQWSPAECVAHLNLTAEAFLPLLRDGLERARRVGAMSPRRYRRGLMGWIVWRAVTPTGRFRAKTPPAFVPGVGAAADALVAAFTRLNGELKACVRAAETLPIDTVTIRSPFDARARYNLYAAMTIVPRHEHRHLLQAERAAAVLARSRY